MITDIQNAVMPYIFENVIGLSQLTEVNIKTRVRKFRNVLMEIVEIEVHSGQNENTDDEPIRLALKNLELKDDYKEKLTYLSVESEYHTKELKNIFVRLMSGEQVLIPRQCVFTA